MQLQNHTKISLQNALCAGFCLLHLTAHISCSESELAGLPYKKRILCRNYLSEQAQAVEPAAKHSNLEEASTSRLEAYLKDQSKGESTSILEAQANAQSKGERNFRLEAQANAQLRGMCNSRLEAHLKAQSKEESTSRLEAYLKAQSNGERNFRLEAQAKAESKVERNFRLEAQLRAQLRGICNSRLEAQANAQLKEESNSRLEAQANAQLKGMCKFVFLNHRYHRHDHENISTSIEMLHLIVHTLKLSPTESMGVHNLINLLFLYRLNPCILDDLSKKAYIEIYMKSASAHILMPTSFAYNRKSIMLYLTSIFNIDSMMSTLNPCMLSDQTDILIRLVFGLYRNLRRIHPDIAEFDKNPLAEIYRIIHLILSDFYNLVYNYNRTIRFKGRYRFFSLKYLKYVFASSANPHAQNPSVFDKINEVAMDVSQKKRVTRIFAIKLDYIYPNIAHVLFT